MAFDESKITEEESQETGIVSQPDTLNGSAAENKAAFDALPNLIIERLNQLIDALQESAAAAELGAAPFEGVEGETVQQQLEQLQDNLSEKDQGVRDDITAPEGAAMVGCSSFEGVPKTNVQAAMEAIQTNLANYIALLLTQEGAANIGSAPFPGVASTNVQQALEEIQQQINDVTAGIIPDYGVTTIKIALQAVTLDRLAKEVTDMIEAAEPARASSELDDFTVEIGTFENAGAGWNACKFRTPFDGVPVVTVTPEEFAGFCEVKQITPEGFLYCLRLPGFSGGTEGSVSKTTVYTGSGAGTSPSHSAVSLVSAVVLPTLPTAVTSTTADPVKIHYTAIEYGGDM